MIISRPRLFFLFFSVILYDILIILSRDRICRTYLIRLISHVKLSDSIGVVGFRRDGWIDGGVKSNSSFGMWAIALALEGRRPFGAIPGGY